MKKLNISNIISCAVIYAAVGFLAPAVFNNFAEVVGVDAKVAVANAQAKQKVTRKLPGISERMLKDLGTLQEFISPNTEENPNAKPNLPEALKMLGKMEKSCKDKCNSVEMSSIYRFYGYTYITMDPPNYNQAISYYNKLVALSPGITVAVELEALYILAQLTYQQEKFDAALANLKKWMSISTIVGSDKIYFWASICYAKNDMRCALDKITEAIDMETAKGNVANEQWYGLQAALLLEKEDYKRAVPVMEIMVRHFHKAEYWTRLANIYGLLGRPKDQLHSLDAVYVMDALTRRQEYVNLASLFLENEAPYKAAQVLERGMKAKAVERDVKNLKLLGLAYSYAKETEDAIKILNEAAKAAKKEDAAKQGDKGYKPEQGNIYTQLTGLYLDLDDSKGAVSAGKKALKASNLSSAGEVHVNMGIAYVDMEQYKSAISSFEKAKKDKKYARFAANWLRHAEQEYERQQQLQKAMKRVES